MTTAVSSSKEERRKKGRSNNSSNNHNKTGSVAEGGKRTDVCVYGCEEGEDAPTL